MYRPNIKIGLAVLGAGTLLVPVLQGTAGAAPSAAPTSRATVAGAVPSWASPERVAGAPDASQKVSIRVALQLQAPAAAEQLVAQLSDPTSANYGKYLSPTAFNDRFAPTATAVSRVENFLSAAGIDVSGVSAGNRWVSATGTVAALDKAFGTTLKTFTVDGKKLRAPATSVTVPSAIAADVSTVTGLSDKLSMRQPMSHQVAADAVTDASPSATRPPLSSCSSYWGQHTQTVPQAYGSTTFNTYICGYQPAQLRQAYGTSALVSHGTDGQGVSVAIIDAYASPTMLADANAYAATFGEPAFNDGQYTETTFPPFDMQSDCGGESGWNGEEALDVEALHGMAPGASIHYIGAQNCDTGIDDALNYVVQQHTADIVSNSYGNRGEQVPADEVALEHSIFVQAAAEGIGMYFSSGDSGDEVANGLTAQPDYPASDSMVTAVGGTSLLLDENAKRVAEVGWETSLDFISYAGTEAAYTSPLPGRFYFGAGGGTSTLFDQPAYQRGTVPDSLARANGKTAKRVAPDISAVGDLYTGFYYGRTVNGKFGIGAIGGTSLSCPLIAGIQAVASQHRPFAIGFANPLLYSLSGNAFADVVPQPSLHYASTSGGYLGTFEAGDTQATRIGYDNITGRGTPNGVVFVKSESAR